MITTLQAVIQGIVEGITEFLPISSTGHLIVSGELLGMHATEDLRNVSNTFEIVIQLGAIVAVVGYYRQALLEQCQRVGTEPRVRRLWLNLLLAFLPAAFCGLLFHHWIEEHLMGPSTVAFSLALGGAVLLAVDRPPRSEDDDSQVYESDEYVSAQEEASPREAQASRRDAGHITDLYDIRPHHALAIGFAQVLSLIPGMSRSACSIIGGMVSGLDRQTATAFSFFLSIPTLGSATIYKLFKERAAIGHSGDFGAFFVGNVVSFLVAWVAIGWLLRYVSSHSFRGFGYYRIGAALVIAGLYLSGTLQ